MSAVMAPQSRLCLICGQTFSGDAERRLHIETDHPGQTVKWIERRPWVVDADGRETRIGASALRRMRANAKKAGNDGPRRTAGGRFAGPVSLRKDTPPAPMVEHALPDDPDAPPWFVQQQPARFAIAGDPVGPTPGAGVDTPPADGPAIVVGPSRETLRAELGQPMLAEIVRNLSIVLSDWDGAGPAGHFSAIEAAQIAMLLHEPTLDAVDRWFGGNVNRFRLAMAAVVILLGKGRVHARAIAAKRAEAVGIEASEAFADELAAQAAPAAVREVAPEAAPLDPIAELAARQHAARLTPTPAAA